MTVISHCCVPSLDDAADADDANDPVTPKTILFICLFSFFLSLLNCSQPTNQKNSSTATNFLSPSLLCFVLLTGHAPLQFHRHTFPNLLSTLFYPLVPPLFYLSFLVCPIYKKYCFSCLKQTIKNCCKPTQTHKSHKKLPILRLTASA